MVKPLVPPARKAALDVVAGVLSAGGCGPQVVDALALSLRRLSEAGGTVEQLQVDIPLGLVHAAK